MTDKVELYFIMIDLVKALKLIAENNFELGILERIETNISSILDQTIIKE